MQKIHATTNVSAPLLIWRWQAIIMIEQFNRSHVICEKNIKVSLQERKKDCQARSYQDHYTSLDNQDPIPIGGGEVYEI